VIRLFLLRHGNTFEAHQTPTQVGAASDLPLTAQGCAQAEHFANYLQAEGVRPQAIYAGSLQRQTKTAHLVQQRMAPPPALYLQQRALTEIDYGPWEGLTSEEIVTKWPEAYKGWTEQGLWAEGIFGRTLQEHREEIDRFLEHLQKSYTSHDTLVAVTSNGVMRFFYAYGLDKWKMENVKVKTGHFCELVLSPHSVKIIQWNVDPWKKNDSM